MGRKTSSYPGCTLLRLYPRETMPVDLYSMAPSAPCRSVLMTAKALGVDVNVKPVNLFAGEHMTPEFLKLNPQHNVPTIDDDGFVLNESRAICTYLVRKYGKDDSLYPKDVQKRALVDQRLYFDMAASTTSSQKSTTRSCSEGPPSWTRRHRANSRV